ncbi:PsiF family protein [Stenotrophomonas humi]|uniref:PsiF family protein n=1 Tax=Stenotrophomonas humi TaxID=405444 RepID=UPI00128FB038
MLAPPPAKEPLHLHVPHRPARLLLATALPLAAATPAATRTPQQQRMADCSAKNKGMKGDAYMQAQRSCLTIHAPRLQQLGQPWLHIRR